LAVVGFMTYRFMSGGMHLPTANASTNPQPTASAQPISQPTASAQSTASASVQPTPQPIASAQPVPTQFALTTNNFIDNLLQSTQPRLAWAVQSQTGQYSAGVNFVSKEGAVVEVLTVPELHALGVMFVKKPYGFDLLYKNAVYILPWGGRVISPTAKNDKVAKNKPSASCEIKPVMTAEEIKACST
jgi:hypothetical protein